MTQKGVKLSFAFIVLFKLLLAMAIAQDMAVVARHAIYPGQIVKQSSIELVDASNCPNCDAGFIQDATAVLGKIAVKTLSPGKLIFPEYLRLAPAVTPGQEVTVFYRKGGLQISMLGTPLNEAAVGEIVSVRNTSSGVLVTGIVQADKTIMVTQ
jgi:flagellar basal body P-ring formation protein FlgA